MMSPTICPELSNNRSNTVVDFPFNSITGMPFSTTCKSAHKISSLSFRSRWRQKSRSPWILAFGYANQHKSALVYALRRSHRPAFAQGFFRVLGPRVAPPMPARGLPQRLRGKRGQRSSRLQRVREQLRLERVVAKAYTGSSVYFVLWKKLLAAENVSRNLQSAC